MENKIKSKPIKSFKSQNSSPNIIPVKDFMHVYFTSKISPSFYKTVIHS